MMLATDAQSAFASTVVAGAVATCVCNRLDILKTELQAGNRHFVSSHLLNQSATSRLHAFTGLFRGAAVPALGQWSYRVSILHTSAPCLSALDARATNFNSLADVNLGTIWIAGGTAGLLTWTFSTPFELIKCRTQLMVEGCTSSYATIKNIFGTSGLRGLYQGSTITLLRDSVGFGWYFWAAELSKRLLLSRQPDPFIDPTSADLLLIGGIAGVVRWGSIYPLDVIKTRIQIQSSYEYGNNLTIGSEPQPNRRSTWITAKNIARIEGVRGFYRGFAVCSFNAFIFNAVSFYTANGVFRFMCPESEYPIFNGI